MFTRWTQRIPAATWAHKLPNASIESQLTFAIGTDTCTEFGWLVVILFVGHG